MLPCPLGEDLPQLPSEAGFERGTGRHLGNDFSFGPLLQCPPHSFTSNNVIYMGFPGGAVKNPLPMQETRVPSLGQEDPLEREMVTHSSTLAWRIPQTEEPGGLQSMGLQSQT